jgi:hypothetical protein
MQSEVQPEDLFLTRIKDVEAKFNQEETFTLHEDQITDFRAYCNLFHQDLTKLSKAQIYRLLRTRKVLKHVFLHLGTELYLLCTLATTITELSKLDQKKLIPKLSQWWNGITLKAGLKDTAIKLCSEGNISHSIIEASITKSKGYHLFSRDLLLTTSVFSQLWSREN